MGKKEEYTEEKPRIGKNGNRLKIVKKGDPSPNPNGRPPKLLKHLNQQLKEKGFEPVKPSQLSEAFEILLNLPEKEIRLISNDLENPYFLRVIAKEILDKKTGQLAVDNTLNRTLGKPKLQIDHTSLGEKIIPEKFEGVTLDQLEKEFESRGLPKPQIDSL